MYQKSIEYASPRYILYINEYNGLKIVYQLVVLTSLKRKKVV